MSPTYSFCLCFFSLTPHGICIYEYAGCEANPAYLGDCSANWALFPASDPILKGTKGEGLAVRGCFVHHVSGTLLGQTIRWKTYSINDGSVQTAFGWHGSLGINQNYDRHQLILKGDTSNSRERGGYVRPFFF